MMAESAYDDWLCEKLRSLQLDDDVFLDYLKGVLDEDSSSEEKAETIENILQGATDEPVTDICNDILQKWNEMSVAKMETKAVPRDTHYADEKILDIIHKQQETLIVSKPSSKTEDEMKKRLLEQYSHVSDNEESDGEENDRERKIKSSEASKSSLFENINAKSVIDQQKAQREKQKKAHDEKREKDRANREAEKLKKQERQEKEKKRTQKGERRR